jgi:hypothetical protein
MMAGWEKHRDTERSPEDYIGEHIGHGTLTVRILENEGQTSLYVLFEESEASRCAWEYYRKDS